MIRIFVRIILAALLIGVSSAQPAPGVSHAAVAVLQKTEIPRTNRQMGIGVAVFPPDAAMSRHESTDPEMILAQESPQEEPQKQVLSNARGRHYGECADHRSKAIDVPNKHIRNCVRQ